MPCQIEDTGVDVSNIFPVMIGSNDNGYCLENNDSRVLWFSLSFCPIQSAILTSILMPTCTIFGPEISKQESTPFPRWFFSCINYKCRNEIFTRICINFVNTLSLTFLPNFLIFIFLCCRLMLIYFFSLVTGHALAMPCKKSDLLWNTEIAVVMFTFLKIVLTSYFREVCKSQDINLMISQFIFLDICFLARKKWQGS